MRILHTTDWHLGRSFHREDLLGQQGAFVDHLLEVVASERVDVVVVSGDVYDRALPHVDAVALADARGALSVVREDVGRHNAVDKVVGARVLAGDVPASACLVLSGRVGFELVQKAAAAGIGSIVAVGAPTSLAARLAAEAGIDLWGFTSEGRTVRY